MPQCCPRNPAERLWRIEVHVVGIDIVHVVVIFIIAHYLENDVALEYGTLVVDQIERLILVQILQYHVVVVFFRYVLVFDPVVILCGYRHQTVQNLYDNDGDEEAAVLLEIEENALPCNGQAPFQVLKKLFQIRNVTESRRTHASTRARSIGESLSVPYRFGRTARERDRATSLRSIFLRFTDSHCNDRLLRRKRKNSHSAGCNDMSLLYHAIYE